MTMKVATVQEQTLLEKIRNLPPKKMAAVEGLINILGQHSPRSKVLSVKPQSSWGDRMETMLVRFREGAKGYSEKEIENIVDEAVQAIRREERRKQKNN